MNRWILMKTDEGPEWVVYLGSDEEWEHIRATKLHETHEGEMPKDSGMQNREWLYG